ncbi:MAG: LysR family transcriptional regulator, partial [Nonomuraea sp.]|nr:LysR family transcriptional regulator [Nonomuraea sp.]
GVVVVPRSHRLAGRAEVTLADLDGEPVARWAHQPGHGPLVRDASELMQLIALGRAVAVVPESVRDQLRADLTCVPVVDAAPTTVVLAWREESRSPALAAFVRAAAGVPPATQGTVPVWH